MKGLLWLCVVLVFVVLALGMVRVVCLFRYYDDLVADDRHDRDDDSDDDPDDDPDGEPLPRDVEAEEGRSLPERRMAA